ncbi:macrophage mannose receptor 1-like [Cyprinodon tularosa]|uniref:macrophage mannose receptor 1-like n=1 Tax=Cyprinodon tularosa TaxID=77115 RepID=UPI0018E1E5CC|nr:macrophage mannose receptor 1-like [Cyprinodon tularosa]
MGRREEDGRLPPPPPNTEQPSTPKRPRARCTAPRTTDILTNKAKPHPPTRWASQRGPTTPATSPQQTHMNPGRRHDHPCTPPGRRNHTKRHGQPPKPGTKRRGMPRHPWLVATQTPPTRQYIIVDELKNWAGAQSYCRDHHTDLATLENMEDVRMLADLGASLANSSEVWIGLYADMNWTWSISDGDQQEEKQFWNWYTAEPNNEFGRESCAAIDIDGSYYDVPCSLTLGTLCVEEKETRKFQYNNQERTWSEAQSYCRERYTDLANIRDTSENQRIKNLITRPVWMGLYRDPWKWVEGRKSSFRFWNIFNPDSRKNECAAANFGNGGKWEKWSCAEKKAFICSAVPSSKQIVKLKLLFSSSAAQNQPAVLDELLRKLKQKLQDDGVRGDLKLSWRKQPDGRVLKKDKKKKDEL